MPEQQPQQQIPVKYSDELLRGEYANQMMIRHMPEEFILDFFNFFPGDNQATVTARIIMAPGHIKRMILAMQENFKKYEEQFGELKIESAQSTPTTTSSSDSKFGFDTNKAA